MEILIFEGPKEIICSNFESQYPVCCSFKVIEM